MRDGSKRLWSKLKFQNNVRQGGNNERISITIRDSKQVMLNTCQAPVDVLDYKKDAETTKCGSLLRILLNLSVSCLPHGQISNEVCSMLSPKIAQNYDTEMPERFA